jgi:hypothetical protein
VNLALLVVVIGGVFSIFSALVVVLTGHWLAVAREDRHWRADRKLDAYATYLIAVQQQWTNLITPEDKITTERRMADTLAWMHARDLMWLVASREVRGVSTLMEDAMKTAMSMSLQAHSQGKDLEQMPPGLPDIDFVAAAHTELGFDQSPRGLGRRIVKALRRPQPSTATPSRKRDGGTAGASASPRKPPI